MQQPGRSRCTTRRCARSGGGAAARRPRRMRATALEAARRRRCATTSSALLLADGELAGFAYFHADGRVDHLLHPRDRDTGIHYRLLPMIHAIINDLLTPEQAAAHVGLIREHLLGADGARLFDRPPPYRGGPQRHFQRAESSTFFGREIGLMYTHAHLRYAEAMARYGDADAFFEALRQAIPIGIRDGRRRGARRARRTATTRAPTPRSPTATRRAERYADVRAGARAARGRLARVLERRRHRGAPRSTTASSACAADASTLGIDPVIPKALDGLCAEVELGGHAVRVRYRVAAKGCGPIALVAERAHAADDARGESVPDGRRHRTDDRRAGASRRRGTSSSSSSSERHSTAFAAMPRQKLWCASAGAVLRPATRPLRAERCLK